MQPDETFGKAYVCLDLAFVYYLSGDATAAKRYSVMALEAATPFVEGIPKKNKAPNVRQN